MKRYYLGGKEITVEQAREVEAKNQEILRSGSIEQLLKIQFVMTRED